MYEATATRTARTAFDRAHELRAETLRGLWRRLTARRLARPLEA